MADRPAKSQKEYLPWSLVKNDNISRYLLCTVQLKEAIFAVCSSFSLTVSPSIKLNRLDQTANAVTLAHDVVRRPMSSTSSSSRPALISSRHHYHWHSLFQTHVNGQRRNTTQPPHASRAKQPSNLPHNNGPPAHLSIQSVPFCIYH